MTNNLLSPSELLREVEESCLALPVDCVLLSGGVDSSLLSACYRKPAITVSLKGASAPDRRFAQLLTDRLGISWLLVEVDSAAAMTSLCSLMTLTTSFNRGLFNDLTVFCALSTAIQRGWRRIASGQGAEILFAGYEFIRQAGPRFREYRQEVLQRTRLSETSMGRKLDLAMVYPYLAPRVVAAALKTSMEDCVVHTAEGRIVSKIPLRLAATKRVPAVVAWRDRADLEFGSGFAALGSVATSFSLGFPDLRNPCKRYWDDSHRALHRIFAGIGLRIPAAGLGTYACTWCGGGVVVDERYCTTCGAYPADR